MASPTKEHTIRESQKEIEVPMSPTPAGAREPTAKSVFEHFREYERERPGVVALWCLGLGFVLGWKLKLW